MLDQTYLDLKSSLHSKVINEIDLESLNRLPEEVAREQLRQVILDILQREKTPLTYTEREQMVSEVLDEVFGLGPLQPLLADPTLSDILVNGAYSVYVERRGKLEKAAVRFKIMTT
jgi:pilus assembly protein CpaF